jgi:hypothetical protein
VKLLVTALVIVAVVYGIYHFAQAAYGWFQMSGVVDDMATKELPGIVDRVQQGGTSTAFDSGDRYGKMREGIMKGAEEAHVPLRREDVAIGIVDNMLEVRLSWDAPIVVYKDKPYLELPMSVQRRFALVKRPGY